MEEWMDVWKSGRMGLWVDGWMDKVMDEQTDV
jgi:hypothetical protein